MLLSLHNCYHITLLKAAMYRIMPQELEGYEIEAHTTCILDNDAGCVYHGLYFIHNCEIFFDKMILWWLSKPNSSIII